ncbi:hypothetical protein NVP1244A_028 [Vibrio phage 1.244.A._10N.261.54.C3]|nr:hypothetical protein NVP1244A_028 [Vibrio phage 1.244.A._10N.261.54.C3]AUR98656.1 hypothetical protein NVP1255O_028 [Vibrio phage 1.255.O._10N.286.45.F1]
MNIAFFGDILTVINNLFVPVGSLGVSRRAMPQIDDNRHEKFLRALDEREIEYERKDILVQKLRLTQNEVNKMKVWKLMRVLRNKKGLPPVFVSSDNYILDGSHRLVAKLNTNKLGKMKTIQIDMKALDILKLIRDNQIEFGVKYRTYSGEDV